MLPQIVTLNVPDQPFSFFAQGNQIIGGRHRQGDQLYPTQATHADESYRLTVTINEREGTFDYNEVRNPPSRRRSSPTTASSSAARRSGTWASASRSLELPVRRPQPLLNRRRRSRGGSGPGHLLPRGLSWIKDPHFGWLQSHGWSHRGLMGRLFVHRATKPLVWPSPQRKSMPSSTFRSEKCGHAATPSCVTTERIHRRVDIHV